MLNLELAISQYLDGTLSHDERALLEVRLAEDAGAPQMLAEETRLTQLLRDALPLPADIRWEALTDHLCSVVASVPEPVQSYRLMPRWLPAPLALAASLLIATGLGISVYLNSNKAPVTVAGASQKSEILVVTGPVAETAQGGMADVSIGPPSQTAGQSGIGRYSDDLVLRPARVVIASGANFSPETSSSLPY